MYHTHFRDAVQPTNALFTFWTAIFVKYDILTEYLTLFWFAMLVNEYKLDVSIQKSLKDAKWIFGQCLYLWVPLCYEQNWCAERTLQLHGSSFRKEIRSSFVFLTFRSILLLAVQVCNSLKSSCISHADIRFWYNFVEGAVIHVFVQRKICI